MTMVSATMVTVTIPPQQSTDGHSLGSLGDIARVQRQLAVWALEACPISRKDGHARRRFSSGDRASRTGQNGTA
jgi:hypothetical protein